MGTEDSAEPDRFSRPSPRLMSDKFSAFPKATARLVVTMPPEPSQLADALAANIASDYIALGGVCI